MEHITFTWRYITRCAYVWNLLNENPLPTIVRKDCGILSSTTATNMFQDVRKHYECCIENNGKHFEHLLFILLLTYSLCIYWLDLYKVAKSVFHYYLLFHIYSIYKKIRSNVSQIHSTLKFLGNYLMDYDQML